ncbi:MAG: glutathione S-transferase family protein [Myxococcota bacterium]|nr:glutathione S-transferase family protein [Myxococcota bacterium]
MTIEIHGGKPSPFARKVIVACEEKGIAYESKDLIPFPKSPELLALNPLGKIPVLKDGDFTIPDSSVIVAYLERTGGGPKLYPEDAKEYARALFAEEYADTKGIEITSPFLWERFIKPKLMQAGDPDEERLASVREEQLPIFLDHLEGQLEEGATTLLSGFSIADVAMGVQLQNLEIAGESVDASRWPRTAHYASALLGRPSFKAAHP